MPAPHQGEASGLRKQSRAGWFLAGVAVLAVLLLGNRPLLTGREAPQWDAADFFGPSFVLAGDEIRAGHLLTWNPWSAGGSPDWAEPQLGSASPLLLAASFLSITPQEGFIAYWMAIWAFSGIGMLLLARHLGAPSWGGAIAAFGWIASGFYTGHAEHAPFVYSASFLPWILWRLDAGLRRGDWWCGVQAGALYGLSALGGYPAFAIVTPAFLFLWALGRVLWRDSGSPEPERPSPRLAAVILALTGCLGALIASFPAIGMLLGARGYSDRVGPRPRDIAISSNLLAAGALTTFASPYLADLNSAPNPLWPETDISLTSIYAGAASLVLAAFAWSRKSGWRWWLVGMAIFFLCCALGSQLPLRGWLYDFVPPARYFRHPALLRAYVILVVAILAALATRDLSDGATKSARLRLCLLSLSWACAAVVAFAVVSRMAGKSTVQLHPAVLHLAVVWFGFAALAYLLYRQFLGVARFLQLAAALAFFDATGALFLSHPTMYASGTLPWWHAMNARHSLNLDLSSTGLARDREPPDFLGAYSNSRGVVIKTSVLDGYVTLWNRFQRAITDDPKLSRMAVGTDRLWFSSAVAWRAPDNASFQRFQHRVQESDGLPILVLHSPEQMLALDPRDGPEPIRQLSMQPLDIPTCLPAAVSDLVYRTDSLSFQYTAPEHGYLLVTDRWADGWQADVNGQRRPVLGADFIFRAVEVDAGLNRVEFSYHPRGFWPLLLVSWGTLLLTAAWQCLRWLQPGEAPR